MTVLQGVKVLNLVFILFLNDHSVIILQPLIAIGIEVVGDGPVRLQFPAPQSLGQADVTYPDGLPIPLGQNRVRDARRREYGPDSFKKIQILAGNLFGANFKFQILTRRWRMFGAGRLRPRGCSPTVLWTSEVQRYPPASGPRRTATER